MRGFCVLLAIVAAATPARAGDYTVTITAGDMRKARVQATLTPEDGVVYFNDEAIHGLPHGWSTFIHDLAFRDAAGEDVAYTYEPTSRWRLEGTDDAPVTVGYTMILEHDRFPLEFGDNGAAYARPEGVMWAGRCLFLRGRDERDITVTFDVPGGWSVSTPWDTTGADRFLVPATFDLVNCAVVAGTHTRSVFAVGDAEVRFALMGEAAVDAEPFLTGQSRRYVGETAAMLGPVSGGNLLVVATQASYWGGEVMGSSISLSLLDRIDNPAVKLMLTRVLAHEVLHLWGGAMNFDHMHLEDVYWFHEGMLGTYLSHLALLEVGDFDEAIFVKQLNDHAARYFAAYDGKVSLSSAGWEKRRYYDIIYSGGFLAAFATDVALRSDSGGEKSVTGFVRYLYETYPHEDAGGPVVTDEVLLHAAAQYGGDEVARMLRRYVTTTDRLNLTDPLGAAGLAIAEDGTITRVPDPDASQSALWAQIVGAARSATAAGSGD